MNQERLNKLIDAISTLVREIVTEIVDMEESNDEKEGDTKSDTIKAVNHQRLPLMPSDVQV